MFNLHQARICRARARILRARSAPEKAGAAGPSLARAAAAVTEVMVEVHSPPPPPAVPAPQPAMEQHLLPAPAAGHRALLQEALRGLAAGGSSLTVTAREGATLCLNLDLLLLHFPWSGTCPSAPPHLLLPDAPLAGLLALDSLLAHGTAGPGDAGQAAAAASLLGVTMLGLEILSPDEPRHKGISVKEKEGLNALSSEEDSNQNEISTAAQSKENEEENGKNEDSVKLSANVDEGETCSKLPDGPVPNDSTVTGGFISVEVYGEDEAVEMVEVKTEPAETDETTLKAPAADKRKDGEPPAKEEEISLKKRKLLDCAIDRLIKSTSQNNSKVVENTKKEKAVQRSLWCQTQLRP